MTQEKEINLKDGQKLRAYMNTVPYGEYNKTLNLMVEACMVPKYTFKNWMNSLCRIPQLAKREIERVAGQKIF